MMTKRQRLVSIVIGVVGAVGSVLALADFLLKIRWNRLELPEAATTQAFYQSVGTAYSRGFTSGFALCFFLTLLAVAVGTWLEGRKGSARSQRDSVPMRLVPPPGRE
jgi:hypothetical protein